MGTGKTTVGKIFSSRVGLELVEMDDLILKKSGRKRIVDIFDIDGEQRYRSIENDVAKSLHYADRCVISTGGGIINNEENIKYLKHNGVIVYLYTSFHVICSRLSSDNSRPLFRDINSAKKLYIHREKIYRYMSDFVITTDGVSVEKITDIIENSLKNTIS